MADQQPCLAREQGFFLWDLDLVAQLVGRLPSVGCSFVIHKENTSQWPCCVLINRIDWKYALGLELSDSGFDFVRHATW